MLEKTKALPTSVFRIEVYNLFTARVDKEKGRKSNTIVTEGKQSMTSVPHRQRI